MTRTPAAIALLVACAAAPLRSQAMPCSWDQCALRLQHRAFDVRIVQGAAGTPVGKLGLFAPRIEPLADASDTVRFHYQAHRRDQATGGVLTLVGSALLFGAFLAEISDTFGDNSGATATVLLISGSAVTFGGALTTRRSHDHLERAIWLYNRSLSGSGGP